MTQRILVVGAGFAGMWSALSAARALDLAGKADGSVEILLVAPEPALHVRPRFYEPPVEAMKAPLSAVFAAAGVRYQQGRVGAIRTGSQEVDVVDSHGASTSLAYDRLVLAAGSRLFRPSVPGLREHGLSVDQFEEAVQLDQHLRKLANLPSTRARNTVVVVGGGFTGIETAAEMPARIRKIMGGQTEARVVIIERESAIGPELGAGPRPVIEKALRDQGVTWKLGTSVEKMDADGLLTSTGERIEAMTVIWTGGMRATDLTEQIPGRRDAIGRLHVDRNLAVTGVPKVFATGDAALAATDDEGNFALMSCQHAMALGRSAGHNVAADLLGLEKIPYSQPKYVTCLDLGPWGAVYTEGWTREVKMEGAKAKALKHQINTEWIYPPSAERAEILVAADPRRVVVA
ncbi:FAD-dependent oxidoreductase [Variovorax robiniae]|uniref:FAD-dependent oxidoreductase n=1 Tax=Variovorax robiniae TaxID=1836199 RepID=A0ABU8XCD8_9BURK